MNASLATGARRLADTVDALRFDAPVRFVYNPLRYARAPHEEYLARFGSGRKKILFLGMNPGPWGMAQTGVPFGEIPAVRDWMGVTGPVGKPPAEHPKRPVQGFGCPKSEVSGRRLWGLFKERFGTADAFFREHFVLNYCPLVFMGETGVNITPDKLPAPEAEPLFAACDKYLSLAIDILGVEWLVAVGNFAESRLREVSAGRARVGRVLHPSPANPAANRGWAEAATKQLVQMGAWS